MILFMTIAYALGNIYFGYVNSILWGWFLVPLGLPAIGVFHACGIQFTLAGFLGLRGMWADMTAYDGSKKKSEAGHRALVIVMLALAPSVLWGYGWLANQFMTGQYHQWFA